MFAGLTLKTNRSLKEVIKFLKLGIDLNQSKQQRYGYLNHADIFIFTFGQM